MKHQNTAVLKILSITGLVAGLIAGVSCGRPDDASLDGRSQNNYTPVDGLAAYGTQCPYGEVGSAKPLRLQLWNCPMGRSSIELTRPIAPIYMQADCKTRVLTLRTLDRKLDTSWYFLPNGEFDVVIDGLTAQVANDGSGGTNCNAPLSINVFGKVSCGTSEATLDKATIKFQSVMWAGARPKARGSSAPAPAPSSAPGLPPPPLGDIGPVGNQCHLPQSCYFYTETELRQCQ